MKKLLLFMLLLASVIFPQLKEMEVKPTENRGGIPILRDYPDKAAVILYTQYDNLSFYSSYGIHNVMGDPASGKYVVIIEPAKQSLEVRSPGHKSEIIKIESLQPRDVLYYEVSPKKEEGIQSIKELGVTVQVAPSDAEIMIDGESFPHNRTKNLSIGKHRLKIQRKYYVTYHEDIVVSTGTTLFQVELSYDVAMVKVNGGTFLRGSNDYSWQNKPDHEVTVSSFLIGKYEVTNGLWENVLGGNQPDSTGSRRPVQRVSWYDVVEFCNKLSEKEGFNPAYIIDKKNKDPNNLDEMSEDWVKWTVTCDFNSNGYRLPTEAEWEYAERGGNKSKGYKYSGSDNIDDVAWTTNNSEDWSNEVGTKQANELGLYDMSGNVNEWCWDWYGSFSPESRTDPRGPRTGSHRVLRGECREDYSPYFKDHPYSGFRLARTR